LALKLETADPSSPSFHGQKDGFGAKNGFGEKKMVLAKNRNFFVT
jgi:hypothetical protein